MHIQDNDTQINLSTVSEHSEMKQNLDIKHAGSKNPGYKRKPNSVGFIGFLVIWGLNPGAFKKPNLTGSGVFKSFKALD